MSGVSVSLCGYWTGQVVEWYDRKKSTTIFENYSDDPTGKSKSRSILKISNDIDFALDSLQTK